MKLSITNKRPRPFLASAMIFGASALTGLSLVDALPSRAEARVKTTTECYKLSTGDSASADEYINAREEVWCYKQLDAPAGSRLVYNIDEKGRTKPELSMLVEADGTITHASLLRGKLTFHKLRADFSPYNIPLTPPRAAERFPEPISTASDDSVQGTIKMFQENGRIDIHTATVSMGTFAESVEEAALPWHGFWFPHQSGRMHSGSDSPMAKYDRFVERRAQTNIGAQEWEAKNHRWTGVKWAGHCNGWAAASILRSGDDVPAHSIVDPYTGIEFTNFDIKGLWTERDYCPKAAFFGHRNWEKPGDDPADVYPATFHNVITYFIGTLKKPVLVDLMSNKPVENRVVSGYKMKVVKIAENTYQVETKLTIHSYDNKVNMSEQGAAPIFPRTYKYILRTDPSGTVKSGTWLSANPDFFWVPMSPSECKDKNPSIDEFWIREILRVSKPKPADAPAPAPSPAPAPVT